MNRAGFQDDTKHASGASLLMMIPAMFFRCGWEGHLFCFLSNLPNIFCLVPNKNTSRTRIARILRHFCPFARATSKQKYFENMRGISLCSNRRANNCEAPPKAVMRNLLRCRGKSCLETRLIATARLSKGNGNVFRGRINTVSKAFVY